MPRILKNIRIDEVSACTKGVGVGTRIVLMKRDDSADDFDEWHREQAAIADAQTKNIFARMTSARSARSPCAVPRASVFRKFGRSTSPTTAMTILSLTAATIITQARSPTFWLNLANTQTVKRLWITCYTPQAGKLCRAACTNTMRTSPL